MDQLLILLAGAVGSGATALLAAVWTYTAMRRREKKLREEKVFSAYDQLQKVKEDVAVLEATLSGENSKPRTKTPH